MHGLVTLLPEPYYTQVTDIWRKLKVEHQLTGINVTPFPHFSWQIGTDYNMTALQMAMEKICSSNRPFTVQTTGLGLFSGPAPVIFIPVVKTLRMLEFHSLVWESMDPVVSGSSPYYNPENWCPHISLAYGDVTRFNLGTVMRSLSFESYNWQFEVENLTFIYEPEGKTGEIHLKHRLSE